MTAVSFLCLLLLTRVCDYLMTENSYFFFNPSRPLWFKVSSPLSNKHQDIPSILPITSCALDLTRFQSCSFAHLLRFPSTSISPSEFLFLYCTTLMHHFTFVDTNFAIPNPDRIFFLSPPIFIFMTLYPQRDWRIIRSQLTLYRSI